MKNLILATAACAVFLVPDTGATATAGASPAPDPAPAPPAAPDPATELADAQVQLTSLQARNDVLTAQVSDLQAQLAKAQKTASYSQGTTPAPEDTIVLDSGSKQAVRLLDASAVFIVENHTGNTHVIAKDRVSNFFRRSTENPETIVYFARGADVPPKDSAEYISIDDAEALVQKVTPAARQASETAKSEDENRAVGTTVAVNQPESALEQK